jgi:CRP-like cAMP-binding protein
LLFSIGPLEVKTQDLTRDAACDLSQFAIEETIEPPATICDAGDASSDALFVIVSGQAVVVGGEAGDPAVVDRVLATLRRGDLIGELSVLDGSPRSATVRPEGGPVRVLRIPGPTLRSALLRRPRVAQSLLGLLASRLRRLAASASPR